MTRKKNLLVSFYGRLIYKKSAGKWVGSVLVRNLNQILSLGTLLRDIQQRNPFRKLSSVDWKTSKKKKKDFLRRFSIDRSCFSFKKENVNNFDSFYNIFIYKNIYFPFMMQFLSRVSKSLPQVLKNF